MSDALHKMVRKLIKSKTLSKANQGNGALIRAGKMTRRPYPKRYIELYPSKRKGE